MGLLNMAKKKENDEINFDGLKWIVPPGLWNCVADFIRLCEKWDSFIEDGPKPLMICGDTGVGKSMFIDIFIQLKGAFTGAIKERNGFLKNANYGILIIEEIGELPFPIQAKLLTFIEDYYYFKVGIEETQSVKVQIIATTNKPKEEFRFDFRNRSFQFYIPPIYNMNI